VVEIGGGDLLHAAVTEEDVAVAGLF